MNSWLFVLLIQAGKTIVRNSPHDAPGSNASDSTFFRDCRNYSLRLLGGMVATALTIWAAVTSPHMVVYGFTFLYLLVLLNYERMRRLYRRRLSGWYFAAWCYFAGLCLCSMLSAADAS
jgi:FtsH-binding integral membrane protein